MAFKKSDFFIPLCWKTIEFDPNFHYPDKYHYCKSNRSYSSIEENAKRLSRSPVPQHWPTQKVILCHLLNMNDKSEM